jgi:hypothetical protein
MATYKYMPGHELSDNNGFVDVTLLKDYKPRVNEAYKFDLDTKKSNIKVNRGLHYIPDEMAPAKHPCNGQVYTSKKKFRDETRARGCIEVGNDIKVTPRKTIELDRGQRREDIGRSIYNLRNGVRD